MHDSPQTRRSSLRWRAIIGLLLLWPVLLLATLWSFGALWYDFPSAGLRHILAGVYLVAVLAGIVLVRGAWRKLIPPLAGFCLVLGWWWTLRPSNDRPWQPDVAQTPFAEIEGDRVTLHNVRNCDYRTETDFTPRWEMRVVDLSKLTGVDLAVNYWGSAAMAHPIVSFQFADAPPVCFSIETRKEIGEGYSAIGGLYRQYELVYICANEEDVLRVRSNFRKGEDVYLYRTTMPLARVRERFMDYLTAMNALHAKPHWYNAITTNCTTTIRTQRVSTGRMPWDWRILLNGYADQMLYDRGAFVTDGLPFAELKQRARVNDAARTATEADFSKVIRAGRPGFSSNPPLEPSPKTTSISPTRS